MRAEYTLALRRESEEFEQAMVEQRVDQAYEQFYEELSIAASQLRGVLDGNNSALRALNQLENGYLRAIEFASRLALGCQVTPRRDSLREQHAAIPIARVAPSPATAVENSAAPDQVLTIRPCG